MAAAALISMRTPKEVQRILKFMRRRAYWHILRDWGVGCLGWDYYRRITEDSAVLDAINKSLKATDELSVAVDQARNRLR